MGDAETPLRIGSMRGASSMGLVSLMDQPRYEFDVVGSPDQLTARLVTGELDAAVLPLNVAATLFNRADGELKLAAVTSLGSLYAVTANPNVTEFNDLAGQSVVATGRGGTPQTVLDALFAAAHLDVSVEYRAEPPEVIAYLTEDPNAVAILPEPFATAVLAQNPDLHVAFDLGEEWRSMTGTELATVVLMVRSVVVEARPSDVSDLVSDIAHSTDWVNEHPAQAAPLIVDLDIVPNAAIAEAAIPRTHLVTWTGSQAREAVEATLTAMHATNPASIGGAIPNASFFLE